MPIYKILRLNILLFLFFFSTAALAVESANFFWDAQQLAKNNTERVHLEAKGIGPVGEINTANVKTLLEIKEKLEAINGVRVPLYINGGQFINAFAFESPGQEPYIAFTLGMMEKFGNDPDIMAAVLGHEMAHIHQHHVLHKIQRQAMFDIFGMLAAALIDSKTKNNYQARNLDRFAADTLQKIVSMKFTREEEADADSLGIPWASKAGYDIQAGVRLFEYLEKVSPSGFSFLSDHPSNTDRIAEIKNLILAKNNEDKLLNNRKFDSELFAIARNRSSENIDQLLIKANQGDVVAESKLGLRLALSDNEKDQAVGVNWLEKAASKNDAFSQAALAVFHMSGKGTSKDNKAAFSLFKRSAENNFPFAQFMVGILLFSGDVVTKDIAESEKWFELAAKSDSSLAKSLLGLFYLDGKVYKKDIPKAVTLLSEAALLNSDLAEQALAPMYLNGNSLGLENNSQKTYELYSKLANKGYKYAMTCVGLYQYNGIGTEKNIQDGIRWLREAQMHGSKSASLILSGKNSDAIKIANDERRQDIRDSIRNEMNNWIKQLIQERMEMNSLNKP